MDITMRKESSTNAQNEIFLFRTCELNSALSIINGRWKSQLVLCISKGYNRFSLLKKVLPNISDQMLSKQLNALECESIVQKYTIQNSIPAGIEYVLTEKGHALIPILDELCAWGKLYVMK
jgi:DNA-binding HxlR family transcriptional regulator